MKTHSGQLVDQVPLASILHVIDMEDLMINGDVKITMPKKEVSFPSSRSEVFKLYRLIDKLAGANVEVKRKIEQQRIRFTRQSIKWLPVSLLAAAVLLLPIIAKHEPPKINIFWGIVGFAYGLSWVWVFKKFAYAIACLFAVRKLYKILK